MTAYRVEVSGPEPRTADELALMLTSDDHYRTSDYVITVTVGEDEPPEADLWVDPARQFGQVCFTGTRVPTESVAGAIAAGDSLEATADDYGITLRQALVGCWWYSETGPKKVRKAWYDWARDAFPLLWRRRGELPDAPPQVYP